MENVEEVRMTFVFKLNLVKDESQITVKRLFNRIENKHITKYENICEKMLTICELNWMVSNQFI